jgi:hypothetical protein
MLIKSNIADFFAGDNIDFTISNDELKSTDNINLKVTFLSATLPKIEIIADNKADGTWSIVGTATETEALGIGKYTVYYAFYNSAQNFVKQATGGSVEIKPNILTTDNYDFRTDNQKLLDVVRQRIAGRLDDTMNSFSINGRSVTLMTITELMTLEKDLISKVNQELADMEKATKGKTNRNKLKVRYKGIM